MTEAPKTIADMMTTADMIEFAYAELSKLEAELEVVRDKYVSKYVRTYDHVYALAREEGAWEDWLEKHIALYRQTHGGTIANVGALELKIDLTKERIAVMKGWIEDVQYSL